MPGSQVYLCAAGCWLARSRGGGSIHLIAAESSSSLCFHEFFPIFNLATEKFPQSGQILTLCTPGNQNLSVFSDDGRGYINECHFVAR